MAGTITSDLVDISAADTVSDAGTWARVNGVSSQNPAAETDAKIQGAGCVATKCGTTVGANDVGVSLVLSADNDISAAGTHLFHWRNVVTPANMLAKASQGVCLHLANGTAFPGTVYKRWFLSGSDVDVIGGWICYVVDPAGTADASAGSFVYTALRTLGFVCRQSTTVGTGLNNHFTDAVRKGTGLTVVDGTAGAPATFADVLAWDNANTRAWGILTGYSESLFGAGKFRIGTAAQTAVTRFKDTDKTLTFRNFPVADAFYEFVISGTASFDTEFQLGNYSGGVASSGCTVSAAGERWWNLTVNANAKALLYACKLNRLRQATLGSTSELRFCTVTNSGTIEANGAAIRNSTFSAHTATQLKIDAPSEMLAVQNCTFTMGASGHAIEISAAGDYTLTGLTFTGYGADATADAALYVSAASGIVNLTVSGGNTPTVQSAGATVNFVTQYTVTVNGLVTGSRVKVAKTSDGEVLFNGAETAGSISFSTTYNGEVQIEARKGTLPAPTYSPWVTVATIGSGLTATALQVRDDQ